MPSLYDSNGGVNLDFLQDLPKLVACDKDGKTLIGAKESSTYPGFLTMVATGNMEDKANNSDEPDCVVWTDQDDCDVSRPSKLSELGEERVKKGGRIHVQVLHEWRAREGLDPSVFGGELSLYLLGRQFAKEDVQKIVDTKKVTGSLIAIGIQNGFHILPEEFKSD